MLSPSPIEPVEPYCLDTPIQLRGGGKITVFSHMPEIPSKIRWFSEWTESGVYDAICDAYDQGREEGWDLALVGSYLIIEMFREGVTKGNTTRDILLNALLLLLALFYPKDEACLPGKNVASLSPAKQREVTCRLEALI